MDYITERRSNEREVQYGRKDTGKKKEKAVNNKRMKRILIGGSPCTHWSVAQKPEARETEAQGLGWELFKNYLIALEKFKPDFFLYENNESVSKTIQSEIEKSLKVELLHLDSA